MDKGSANNMRKNPRFSRVNVCKRDHMHEKYIREDMMVAPGEKF
jgi:hypothetical protein